MNRPCTKCGHYELPYVYTGEEAFFETARPFAVHNAPLLDPQIAGIRESLTEAEDHLSRVDAQMNNLKSILQQLNGQRKMLQCCVDEHKSALSPTRRLPTEILTEIFACSLRLEDYDTLDTSQGPWRLGQVCSRWRTIMTYDRFWSAIRIEINSAYLNINAIPVLEEWLSRSRDSALSIEFHHPDSTIEVGQSILDTLLFHSRRWRSAQLNMMLDMFLWLMQAKGHFPSLEKLLINRLDRGPMQTIAAFEDAPKLRDVTIQNMQSIFTFVHIPWSQLTHYDAVEWSSEDHLEILSRTVNLAECTLYAETHVSLSENLTHVTLPHLTKLTWNGGGLSQRLTLPSLSTVSIQSERRGEELLNRLMSLIRRSQCTLQSLSLDMPLHRLTNLQELLHFSSALTKLDIHLYQPSSTANQIISSLHVTPGRDYPTTRSSSKNNTSSVATAETGTGAPILPNLAHLSITLSSQHHNLTTTQPFDHISFVEMVESRWRVFTNRHPVTRLRSLRFEDNDVTTPPKSLSGLRALKKEGLEVAILPMLLRDAVFVQ